LKGKGSKGIFCLNMQWPLKKKNGDLGGKKSNRSRKNEQEKKRNEEERTKISAKRGKRETLKEGSPTTHPHKGGRTTIKRL